MSDEDPAVQRDDVMWIAISDSPPGHTVIRGPYTNESAAVESVAEFDTFHVEPRIPQSDGDESCVAENIHPTY